MPEPARPTAEEARRDLIRRIANDKHGEHGQCLAEDCETCNLAVQEFLAAQAQRDAIDAQLAAAEQRARALEAALQPLLRPAVSAQPGQLVCPFCAFRWAEKGLPMEAHDALCPIPVARAALAPPTPNEPKSIWMGDEWRYIKPLPERKIGG